MSDEPEHTPSRGALLRPFLDRAGGDPGGRNGHRNGGGPDHGERPAAPPAAAGTPFGPLRPFVVTAGRTASAEALPVETQVIATSRGETAAETLSFEYRDIVTLCIEPIAVAEIAARLSLHLGVTRVLVGDLQDQGMVTTHAPDSDAADDVETIMRVIHGLRQLG
jgi:hypothetical protein